MNHRNEQNSTRIVELKHATNQQVLGTTIVRESPADYDLGMTPYYPIPSNQSQSLYQRYAELALRESNVTFHGRLGTCKYYNMDQVVEMALAHYDRIVAEIGASASRC